MKKCFIHGDKDASFTCSQCARPMCVDCRNLYGSSCASCQCKESNSSFAENLKKISRLQLERNILLIFLLLSTALIIAAMFASSLRPLSFWFFIIAAIPAPVLIFKTSFQSIKSFAQGEGNNFSSKLFTYVLTFFYLAFSLAGGMMTNIALIVLCTFKIRVCYALNSVILEQFTAQLKGNGVGDFLFIS